MGQKLKMLLAEDAQRKNENLGAERSQTRGSPDSKASRNKRDRESEQSEDLLPSSSPHVRTSFDVLQSEGTPGFLSISTFLVT